MRKRERGGKRQRERGGKRQREKGGKRQRERGENRTRRIVNSREKFERFHWGGEREEERINMGE
jgi:hypothetical protein